MDAISTIKHEPNEEEPDDGTLDFCCPDDQPKQILKNLNDKNRARSDDFRLNVLTQPSDRTSHGDTLGVVVDGKDKEQTASAVAVLRNKDNCLTVSNFERSSVLESDEKAQNNEPSLFWGHIQHDIPDDSKSQHSLASDNIGLRENDPKPQFKFNLNENSVTSKHDEIQQPETILKSASILDEKLSCIEPLPMETSEVHISVTGYDENMSDVVGLRNNNKQTVDHSALVLNSGLRRSTRKGTENKRTMQIRTSSGALPKSLWIPDMMKNDPEKMLSNKTYSCYVCNESFPTRISLRRHASDVHDGLRIDPGETQDSVTFTRYMCPLCDVICKRKFGLKRHLMSKHSSSKNISCIKCSYKAGNCHNYLKHIDKHDPTKPTSLQSPMEVDQPNIDQFNCHECHEVFKNKDTLNLHYLNHKLIMSLSHIEKSVLAENNSNCTCLSNANKIADNLHCALHWSSPDSSSTNNDGSHQISCIGPPEELKLKSEKEKSVDIMFKVTSKLESLAHSVRAYCRSSLENPMLLPTINHVSTLSSELANLTTTLGHILLCKNQIKAEDIPEDKNVDLVEDNSEESIYVESDDCKNNKKNEKILHSGTGVSDADKIFREDKKQPKSNASLLNFDHDHICPECGKKLSDRAGLKRHLLTHNSTLPFKCTVCNKAFRRKEHLKRHMVKHSNNRSFKCEVCNYAAKTSQSLYRHSLTHEEDQGLPVLACQKCSFKGRSALVISKHEEIHKPCQLCGYEAIDVNDYQLHKSNSCKANSDGYECQECKKKFKDRAGLKQHMLIHNAIRPFECKMCTTSFRRRDQLKRHMVKHSEDHSLKCQICSYAAVTAQKLYRHCLDHEKDQELPVLTCKKCSFKCRTEHLLSKHEEVHRPCRLCGYEAIDIYDYQLHKSNTCKANSDHDHSCQECGKKLSDRAGLKRHMLIHGDIRPFECKMCKMAFRRMEHLKRHMVQHSEDRPFQCEFCDYAAKTAQNLHRHSLTHEEDKELPVFACQKCLFKGHTAYALSKHEEKHWPCRLCGYQAVDDSDYKLHKRSHLVYSCTECDYSSYANWRLQQHVKCKHNPPGSERFCCELCGFTCSKKSKYTYHMIRHENKTPYACQDCDYKCSSRASFESHKLMHAGLKPYLCSACGNSFRTVSGLNSHILIHKDVKKHVCRTCGRRFRALRNLKTHEMIHTGEKPYKCQFCDFACRRNKELRRHISSKHTMFDEKNIKPLPLQYQYQAGNDTLAV